MLVFRVYPVSFHSRVITPGMTYVCTRDIFCLLLTGFLGLRAEAEIPMVLGFSQTIPMMINACAVLLNVLLLLKQQVHSLHLSYGMGGRTLILCFHSDSSRDHIHSCVLFLQQ